MARSFLPMMWIGRSGSNRHWRYELCRHASGAKLRAARLSCGGLTSRSNGSYDGVERERPRPLEEVVEFRTVDLTESAAVEAVVADATPRLWIHHAGFARDYASLDYDLQTGLSVNVSPLTRIYALLAGGGCRVIITGSSAEYGSNDTASREHDICWPDLPYGLAKLAETIRARQLAERYRVPTRVARLFIPFGRLDNPEKLVAQVVRSLRVGEPIDLSPCEQRRDFLGMSDVCAAYQTLDEDIPRTLDDVFNVCSGEVVQLKMFLQEIAARMNADVGLHRFGRHSLRPGEAAMFFGSIEKAARLLKWWPSDRSISLERDLLTPLPEELRQ
jgi:nucleoside-diphosphate-sugar epimerase